MYQNYKEFLAAYSKKDLTEIRKHWQFSGISQLNKDELVNILAQKIKANLEEWLGYQSSRQIDFLRKVIKKQQKQEWVEVTLQDILPPAINNFYQRGIIDFKESEAERAVKIPLDLAVKIEKIINDSKFQKQTINNDQLLKFAWGLLAYYGALTTIKLIEFYDLYFQVGNNSAEFYHFLKLVDEAHSNTYDIEYYDHFFLYSGVFNPKELIRERKMRPQIDYYRPAKKDILYAGEHDQEKLNFIQQKFIKKLYNDFSLTEDEIDDISWTMMLDIKNDINTMEIMQKLSDKLEFDDFEQAQTFFQEMNEFHNHTRLWVLKGHTPAEIMEEERKHLRPLPEEEYKAGSQGEQTVVKGKKVGRNDPCPCGSGKKYKKCCLGKN